MWKIKQICSLSIKREKTKGQKERGRKLQAATGCSVCGQWGNTAKPKKQQSVCCYQDDAFLRQDWRPPCPNAFPALNQSSPVSTAAAPARTVKSHEEKKLSPQTSQRSWFLKNLLTFVNWSLLPYAEEFASFSCGVNDHRNKWTCIQWYIYLTFPWFYWWQHQNSQEYESISREPCIKL